MTGAGNPVLYDVRPWGGGLGLPKRRLWRIYHAFKLHAALDDAASAPAKDAREPPGPRVSFKHLLAGASILKIAGTRKAPTDSTCPWGAFPTPA